MDSAKCIGAFSRVHWEGVCGSYVPRSPSLHGQRLRRRVPRRGCRGGFIETALPRESPCFIARAIRHSYVCKKITHTHKRQNRTFLLSQDCHLIVTLLSPVRHVTVRRPLDDTPQKCRVSAAKESCSKAALRRLTGRGGILRPLGGDFETLRGDF